MAHSAPDRARLVGINHVALEVGSIPEAIEFFQSIFEFELRSRFETAAFLDMGDQFLALVATDDADESVDSHRHFGLVVDDVALVERRLDELGIEPVSSRGLEFRDPWGNRIQIVAYGEIQFTKADHVLAGQGLSHLDKSDDAIAELAEKGMAPE